MVMLGKIVKLIICKVLWFMENYLKIYRSHDDAESSVISDKMKGNTPKFSYCIREAEVHKTYEGDEIKFNGHSYVDLALPSGTKWAKCNIGAENETDNGMYFQYGKGEKPYQITSGETDYKGDEDPLSHSADTATIMWQGERTRDRRYLMAWHMPTVKQIDEMLSNTVCTWEKNYNKSGKSGFKFTGYNNQHIFIPISGTYVGGSLVDDDRCCLWSSTPDGGHAAVLDGYANDPEVVYAYVERYFGLPIRPVFGDLMISLSLT